MKRGYEPFMLTLKDILDNEISTEDMLRLVDAVNLIIRFRKTHGGYP